MSDLLSFRVAAQRIGVSRSVLTELCYKGQCPFVRDSGGWRFVQRDDVERMRDKIRSGELSIDHAARRLDDEVVRELLKLYHEGRGQLNLSLRFGVDISTVHRLVHRERRTEASREFRYRNPRPRGTANKTSAS